MRTPLTCSAALLSVWAYSASAQQITKESVDNMLRMCGSGQLTSSSLEGSVDLLKRLGIVGGSATKSDREIASIIDNIKDDRLKIDALKAIQQCNFEYLRMKSGSNDRRNKCIADFTESAKHVHLISSENSVRCEGAGVSGKGQSKSGSVILNAPNGYYFTGSATPTVTSENRGHIGGVVYAKTGDFISSATVPISCSSPNQFTGPGAWIHVRLTAQIAAFITKEQMEDINKKCNY